MGIWELVSTLGISAATAVVVTWAGAKMLAGKWLDARFASSLETLRLEGQKQLESARQQHANYLERLKFDRAGLLDRAAKLNQREFEIIPDIWKNATEAHYAMLRLISRWQQCPDVGRMSEPRFEAFLEGSRLEAWQKEEIRALNRFERTTYYSDAEQWFRLQDANAAIVAFNRAAANGSIFLHPETHSKFEGFGDLMRNAFQRWSLNQQLKQDGDPIPKDEEDPVQMYREQGDPLYQGLSSYLRERYWISPQGEAI